MSILEKIRKSRESLKNVEISVTREDGTVIIEKRSADGGIVCIDSASEGEPESDKEIVLNRAHQSKASQVLSTEASVRIALSNRQLRSRLRRQRLGFVFDLNPDLQMANVSKNVYLGSQDVAHDFDILCAHKITHIINCATGVKNIFLGRIRYLTLDVLDLPCTNLEQYFDECHDFIRKCIASSGNVLVHCNAGVSRSATLVISYIMKYDNMSLREALDHVNSIRKVNPNPGFMRQLTSYEAKLTKEKQ